MDTFRSSSPALLTTSMACDADLGPRRVIDCVTSARGRRVIYLLMGVWILNAFDLTLTICAEADGILHEQNPVAKVVLSHGAPAIFAFKAALVVGASYVLFNLRRYRCAELATSFVVLAYFAVAMHWKLCYELYEISHTGRVCPAELARFDRVTGLLPMF